MNYWLCRNESAASEGPYLRAQIEAMFDRAELTTRSIVCPEGSKEWRPVLVMLGHVSEEEFLREQAIKKKALKKKRREKLVLKASLFFLIMASLFVALMVIEAKYNSPEAVAARQAEQEIRARDAQARRQSDRELQSIKSGEAQKRWDAVAAAFKEAGASVKPSNDPEVMRVVIPFRLARQLSEYELKSLAKMAYSRLGDTAQVYIQDEAGNDLAKAWIFGASADK